RDLAPDLSKLTSDNDASVREAAARALGQIVPEPKPATAALGVLLGHKEAGSRRAAADGLAGLLRTMVELTRGKTTGPLEVPGEEPGRVCVAVVPQAARGLADDDAGVRRDCLEALQLAGQLLRDLIPDAAPASTFPPPGRKPSDDEQKELEAFRMIVEN